LETRERFRAEQGRGGTAREAVRRASFRLMPIGV
jgi:hypothetical protein